MQTQAEKRETHTHTYIIILHHTSYLIHHTSYIIHHTSYIIHHTYQVDEISMKPQTSSGIGLFSGNRFAVFPSIYDIVTPEKALMIV